MSGLSAEGLPTTVRVWWNPRSGFLHLADDLPHLANPRTRCGRPLAGMTRWAGATTMGNPQCWTCWKERTDG